MTAPARFVDLAQTSAQLASTRSRLKKKQILVERLKEIPAQERPAAIGWLVAEPLGGPIGVGPSQLWELSRSPPATDARVTLAQVEVTLQEARAHRAEAFEKIAALFGALTEIERSFFAGALTGTLRQGSLGGVMSLAVSELSGRAEADVRRAVLLTGSIAAASRSLLGEGGPTADATGIVLFRPLAPMLAATAQSLEEALASCPRARIEWKVDGVRAQVHKKGERVAVYSRQGNDITPGCAALIPVLAEIAASEIVLDGEVLLMSPRGEPRAFQDSFSAIASKGATRRDDVLRFFAFDCLLRDGVELLDAPLSARVEALEAAVQSALRMPNIVLAEPEEAKRFAVEAIAAGHEGVMVKDLDAPYALGARGRAWQKVKEAATADLVVLAVEWGSGRRQGLLSNLHLGARRDDGSFCMVGKTFKGLTDALLRWQTEELERRETRREGHVVFVRPELVVEVRFNDVQRSPRYPGGIALRFARVVRYRPDKSPAEADRLVSLAARVRGPAPAQLTLF